MFEVRIHGWRGQGVVTAAELLAIAASLEGRYAQALPCFGAGRVAGEVVAYCRIDDDEIGTQEAVTSPDALIVEDQALLTESSVLDGLRADSYLLVDSDERIENLALSIPLSMRRITVPATGIAKKLTGRSAPVTALLGGFAALSGAVLLDSVLIATRQRFHGPAGKAHATAAVATFRTVQTELEDLAASNLFG